MTYVHESNKMWPKIIAWALHCDPRRANNPKNHKGTRMITNNPNREPLNPNRQGLTRFC